MALMNEPTAPYHSARGRPARPGDGGPALRRVIDVELARQTGLGTERLTVLLRNAPPGGVRRAGRRRRVRRRCRPRPAGLRPRPRPGTARETPADHRPAARLGRRRDLHQPLHRRRGARHPVRRGSRDPRGERMGGLPGSSAHASAVGKNLLRSARPERPARPPLPPQDGPPHLADHHQRAAAAVPARRPAGHGAGARPPGVRDRHGLRGRPHHRGLLVGCLALSLPVEHAHRLRRAADTLNRGATPVLLSLAI